MPEFVWNPVTIGWFSAIVIAAWSLILTEQGDTNGRD